MVAPEPENPHSRGWKAHHSSTPRPPRYSNRESTRRCRHCYERFPPALTSFVVIGVHLRTISARPLKSSPAPPPIPAPSTPPQSPPPAPSAPASSPAAAPDPSS